jgi:hypothetical protein
MRGELGPDELQRDVLRDRDGSEQLRPLRQCVRGGNDPTTFADAGCVCTPASCPTGCCRGNTCAAETVRYRDADGGGYGNESISMAACSQPTGYVADHTDCGDSDAVANPNFYNTHSSNPWQTVANACGHFLWNCESNGLPVMQYVNLTLCDDSFCIGSCPNGYAGYSASNPGCGADFIQQSVGCRWRLSRERASMSIDSLTQGC